MAPKSATVVEAETISKKAEKEESKLKPHKAAFWDPTSLSWTEKYDKTFEKIWSHVPEILRGAVITVAIFLVGLAMTGRFATYLISLCCLF